MINTSKSIEIVKFISQKSDEMISLKIRHIYDTCIEDGFYNIVTTDSGTWKIPASTIISIHEFYEEEDE